MTEVKFKGFATGSSVAVTVTQNDVTRSQSIASWAQPSNLPTLLADDWTLTAEDGLTADTAIVGIDIMPDDVNQMQADALIAEVDGAQIYLPFGAQINDEAWRPKRRIRISTVSPTSVRTRIVWRDTTNGATELSGWSDAKTVGPATIAPPTIVLHMPRSSGVAPFGVQVMAEVFGSGKLDPFNECHVKWNFGDPGSTHTPLSSRYVAVHGSNQANEAYDPLAAHTYTTPGDHTITATVTIDGVSYTQTATVTVEDPDVVFAGSLTVFVDPALPAAGTGPVPAGAAVVATLTEAQLVNAAGSPSRIIIQAGLDLDEPTLGQFEQSRLVITAAPGPRPILRNRVIFRYNPNNIDCAMSGIDIIGPYDPSNPDAVDRPASGVVLNGFNTTIHDCVVRGWNMGFDPAPRRRFVLSSCLVTDWADYGMLNQTDTGWHSIVGSAFVQNPLAMRASGKAETTAPVYADHGPYRCSWPDEPACISQTELFSSNSWANGIQLICRWNAAGLPGRQFVMSQCKTEGGSFYFGSTSSPTPASAQQFRVTKTHHNCTVNGMIGTSFGGAHFENNIIVMGDTLQESSTGMRNALSANETHDGSYSKSVYPNRGQAYKVPIKFLNNSLIDLRSLANATNFARSNGPLPFLAVSARDFETVIEGSNLFHAPHLLGGVTVSGLDLTSQFEPRYQGRLVLGEANDTLQTGYSNTGLGIVPVPAAQVGNANEAALDDFFGDLRTLDHGLGALKPLT